MSWSGHKGIQGVVDFINNHTNVSCDSFKLPIEFIEFLKQEGALEYYLNQVYFELNIKDLMHHMFFSGKLNIMNKYSDYSKSLLKQCNSTVEYFLLILSWNSTNVDSSKSILPIEYWDDLYIKLINSKFNVEFKPATK